MTPKSKEETAKTAREKANDYMTKYGSCAQSTLLALQDTFEMRNDNIFKAAGAMTGGIGGMNDAWFFTRGEPDVRAGGRQKHQRLFQ
jgi:hypothetical protein